MSIEERAPSDPCTWSFHPDVGAWPSAGAGPPEPDANVALVEEAEVIARLSVWRRGTAMYRNLPTRYLGHVAARDQDALTTLLRGAAASEAGPDRYLLGPIDGSTWSRYRVVIDEGDAPPFPLEPTNPPWWAAAFERAGFSEAETYWSGARDVRASPPLAQIRPPSGVVIRDLCKDRLSDELTGIYDLAAQAFAVNPLYKPISRSAFRAMYEPLAELIDPRLCIVAERAEAPIGVMLAIPADHSRLVLKTIAVAERERGSGLGRFLLNEVAYRGQALGFSSLIYALMHDNNRSSAMVRKVARPMRRYALFAFGGDR